MTLEQEHKIRAEFQKYVEAQLWQGEDEFTKNIPVGNVADWWINKIKNEIPDDKQKGIGLYKQKKI